MVVGVLLAIGGEDDKRYNSKIYGYHPVDQKWHHVVDIPYVFSNVNALLLSEGRLLVVDGISHRFLRINVEGKSYYK